MAQTRQGRGQETIVTNTNHGRLKKKKQNTDI